MGKINHSPRPMAALVAAAMLALAPAYAVDYGKFDSYTLRVKLIGSAQYGNIYQDLNKVIGKGVLPEFQSLALKNATVNGRLVQLPRHSDVSNLFYQKFLYADSSNKKEFKDKYGYDLASPKKGVSEKVSEVDKAVNRKDAIYTSQMLWTLDEQLRKRWLKFLNEADGFEYEYVGAYLAHLDKIGNEVIAKYNFITPEGRAWAQELLTSKLSEYQVRAVRTANRSHKDIIKAIVVSKANEASAQVVTGAATLEETMKETKAFIEESVEEMKASFGSFAGTLGTQVRQRLQKSPFSSLPALGITGTFEELELDLMREAEDVIVINAVKHGLRNVGANELAEQYSLTSGQHASSAARIRLTQKAWDRIVREKTSKVLGKYTSYLLKGFSRDEALAIVVKSVTGK